MYQAFVGKHPSGADLHQVAGEFALQNTLLVPTKIHMVVGGHRRQIRATGVITVVPGAAVAGDAAVHLVVDQGAQVLVAVRIFAAAIVAVPMAYHDRHVL